MRIDDKPVNHYKCWNRSLIRMADLYYSDQEVLLCNQIISKYGSCIMFKEYYSLLKAIPKLWKCIVISSNFEHATIMAHTQYDKPGTMGKIMNVVYKKYCSKTYWLDDITWKWEKLFDRLMSNKEILGYIGNIYKSTTSTKLCSLQYRLMFHTAFMNTVLYKWKVVPCRLCTFCGECNESIKHLMWQCSKIQPIWVHVKNIVKKYTGPMELNVNLETVLLSLIHSRSNHVAHLIATAIKQTIFCSKCGNTIPTIQQMN